MLPFFHGNAQYYSTMSTLVTGASMAMTARFSASRYFDLAIAAGSRPAQEQRDVYRAALTDNVDDTLVRAGQRAASLMTALWQTRFTPTEAPCPKVWETQAGEL